MTYEGCALFVLGIDMQCPLCKTLVRSGEKHTCQKVEYPYIYRWNRMERKGQRCRVLQRSAVMNSALVEFEDGYQAITSRNALRKATK